MQLPATLVAALRRAKRVCVLTGAGISAESGVPTFRDAQSGLWARYDPLQLATPEAFDSDPALVWRWYRWRRELVRAAEPNAGHFALARLARRIPHFTLVTQNVDALHQRAGSPDVIEFHGNLFETRCASEDRAVTCDDSADIPVCTHCGGPLRPGVVWFGEAIDTARLEASFAAAADCDLFFSIGTSSLVAPAAALADVALQAGAAVVEINPEPTGASAGFDFAIAERAGIVLPELVDSLAD